MDLWHFLLSVVKTEELNEETCGAVVSSAPFFLQVWPAGYGLWAVWSEVGEAGVKDAAHLEDERLHVEPATFRQGGTKQVFCSGNLWRSVRRKGPLLLLYVFPYPSIFCCLFTFKLESIGFEAKEKTLFLCISFALTVDEKNLKTTTKKGNIPFPSPVSRMEKSFVRRMCFPGCITLSVNWGEEFKHRTSLKLGGGLLLVSASWEPDAPPEGQTRGFLHFSARTFN